MGAERVFNGHLMGIEEFRAAVYANFKINGRDFPWRKNTDPWGVFVSEFMLQQTQTGRVVEYWKGWMEKWPSPASLSRAPLEEVLREWSGLGYNRRGKYLLESAKVIAAKHGGKVPAAPEELVELPGIGPYTAGAISCFAYNYPVVFIETNIRSVMLHFFFPGKEGVKDGEILPVLEETMDRSNPRRWYWALMDYGASLKKLTPNPNRRSAHYTRQSVFSGSFRQIRGGIVRTLSRDGPAGAEDLLKRLDSVAGKEDFYRALEILEKESMVAEEGGIYRIK
jgi:A/G-specific adenine glycosylase